MPGHPFFEELITGPEDESPNYIRTMRHRGHNGGKEAVIAHCVEISGQLGMAAV
jgi:hypothetical protein